MESSKGRAHKMLMSCFTSLLISRNLSYVCITFLDLKRLTLKRVIAILNFINENENSMIEILNLNIIAC